MLSPSAQASATAMMQPLEAMLQPMHSDADELDEAPLTLVEDSLACPADFLLLHALRMALPSTTANASSALQGRSDGTSDAPRGPAVVLCHFKNAASHYTHIARKWGVSLPAHTAAGSLYLCSDLAAPLAAAAADASAAASAAPVAGESTAAVANAVAPHPGRYDGHFRTVVPSGSAFSSGGAAATPSALSAWVRSLLSLRTRHSSLTVLVDQLDWLSLHAEGAEMEALDALVTLQHRLADMDDEEREKATAAASGVPSSQSPSFRRSSLLLVSHGDIVASPAHSLLRRHASTFVRLSGLSTGWSAEVSGVLTVQHQRRADGFWAPPQRAHYKLTDTGVKLAAPGHSTALLEQ